MPDPDPTVWEWLWTSSADSDQVISAFVQALNDMHDIQVDRGVEAGPMRYKYATLGAVLDEVKPKLAAKGLAMSQSPTSRGVLTTIFHESGQWLRFPPLNITPVGNTPQHHGSAISYARRYSILSICDLATEDDDGAAASVAPNPATAAHNPVKIRIDSVLDRLSKLGPAHQAETKTWADGRKLSGQALLADADWLAQVEGYLDVLDGDIARQAEAETAHSDEPTEAPA